MTRVTESGRSAVVARAHGVREVAGSTPVAPTLLSLLRVPPFANGGKVAGFRLRALASLQHFGGSAEVYGSMQCDEGGQVPPARLLIGYYDKNKHSRAKMSSGNSEETGIVYEKIRSSFVYKKIDWFKMAGKHYCKA